MPIFGINQAMQPIIGYNYGAKKFLRSKRALKLGMLFATSICVISFAAVMLFAYPIMSIFVKDDPAVIQIGGHGLRIFLAALPFIGFQVVGTAYFQAIGHPKETLFLSLLRQIILLVPLLAVLPVHFGLNGVWMAGPISDTIAAVITAILLAYALGSLNKKIVLEKELTHDLTHRAGPTMQIEREIGTML